MNRDGLSRHQLGEYQRALAERKAAPQAEVLAREARATLELCLRREETEATGYSALAGQSWWKVNALLAPGC